jgi:hypothetical protein
MKLRYKQNHVYDAVFAVLIFACKRYTIQGDGSEANHYQR